MGLPTLHLPQTFVGTDPPLCSWEKLGPGEELQKRVEKVKDFPFPPPSRSLPQGLGVTQQVAGAARGPGRPRGRQLSGSRSLL